MSQAIRGLRSFVLWVDEVAFEVGWQHACRSGNRRNSRLADLPQHAAKIVGTARHRCRAKRCDAVSRQQRSDVRDRALTIERVVSVKAVHVDIDEAWRHVTVARVDDRRSCRIDTPRLDRCDAATVDDQRPLADEAPGQNQVATADDDHGAILSPSQSICT